VNEFSGGQQQRIGMPAALALQPSCSSATSQSRALDVSVQAQILNLLRDLQQSLAHLSVHLAQHWPSRLYGAGTSA